MRADEHAGTCMSTTMKIHEYQAKAILAALRRARAAGRSRFTPRRPARPRGRLGGTVVVKAQIHAGGRGKGGGVKVVKGPDEARAGGGRR